MIVELDNGAQELPATASDRPTTRAGDSGYQASHVKALQQTGDSIGLTPAMVDVGDISPRQVPDVSGAEAT
ncbi:MAG TPA: hypothetical protein EYH34_07590 [Planctomycetes bacterium]|nr:hypothetical protein [Planctomycetota bacterium]